MWAEIIVMISAHSGFAEKFWSCRVLCMFREFVA
jgi:hypothetical protein